MSTNIAIQGIEGSYHEIAVREFFRNERIDLVECMTFQDVLSAVRNAPETLGMMAIENTIAGSLLQNHELIRQSGLTIIGEYKLRIEHCLAALPGTRIADIRQVASHPIALRQCERFLDEQLPEVGVIEKNDTATSARWIAENRLEHHAAICSRQAARNVDLELLAENIETNRHNFTRFLVLADRAVAKRYAERQSDLPDNNKASLVFSLPHNVGSLSKVLTILSFYEVNLTKIQSFPLLGAEWQYLFYVDFTFPDYYVYQRAVDAVLPLTKGLRILGEYREHVETIHAG